MRLTNFQMLRSPRNGMTRKTVIGFHPLSATLLVMRHLVVANGNGV